MSHMRNRECIYYALLRKNQGQVPRSLPFSNIINLKIKIVFLIKDNLAKFMIFKNTKNYQNQSNVNTKRFVKSNQLSYKNTFYSRLPNHIIMTQMAAVELMTRHNRYSSQRCNVIF